MTAALLSRVQPIEELLTWLSALRDWLLAFPASPGSVSTPAVTVQIPVQLPSQLVVTPTPSAFDQPSTPPAPQLTVVTSVPDSGFSASPTPVFYPEISSRPVTTVAELAWWRPQPTASRFGHRQALAAQ